MKHKYLVMWHPKLGWGAPLPTLHRSREDVTKATGLTNQKIRLLGWKWVKVEFDTPDPRRDDGTEAPVPESEKSERIRAIKAQIEDLLAEVGTLGG